DYVYVVYSHITAVGNDQVRVLRSPDGGSTWSGPVTVTGTASNSAQFISVPDAAIGPNHELYIAWGDPQRWIGCGDLNYPFNPTGSNIFTNPSLDHGATFTGEVVVAPIFSTYNSAGPGDLVGNHKANVRIAADRSSGPNRGNVYMTWT